MVLTRPWRPVIVHRPPAWVDRMTAPQLVAGKTKNGSGGGVAPPDGAVGPMNHDPVRNEVTGQRAEPRVGRVLLGGHEIHWKIPSIRARTGSASPCGALLDLRTTIQQLQLAESLVCANSSANALASACARMPIRTRGQLQRSTSPPHVAPKRRVDDRARRVARLLGHWNTVLRGRRVPGVGRSCRRSDRAVLDDTGGHHRRHCSRRHVSCVGRRLGRSRRVLRNGDDGRWNRCAGCEDLGDVGGPSRPGVRRFGRRRRHAHHRRRGGRRYTRNHREQPSRRRRRRTNGTVNCRLVSACGRRRWRRWSGPSASPERERRRSRTRHVSGCRGCGIERHERRRQPEHHHRGRRCRRCGRRGRNRRRRRREQQQCRPGRFTGDGDRHGNWWQRWSGCQLRLRRWRWRWLHRWRRWRQHREQLSHWRRRRRRVELGRCDVPDGERRCADRCRRQCRSDPGGRCRRRCQRQPERRLAAVPVRPRTGQDRQHVAGDRGRNGDMDRQGHEQRPRPNDQGRHDRPHRHAAGRTQRTSHAGVQSPVGGNGGCDQHGHDERAGELHRRDGRLVDAGRDELLTGLQRTFSAGRAVWRHTGPERRRDAHDHL